MLEWPDRYRTACSRDRRPEETLFVLLRRGRRAPTHARAPTSRPGRARVAAARPPAGRPTPRPCWSGGCRRPRRRGAPAAARSSSSRLQQHAPGERAEGLQPPGRQHRGRVRARPATRSSSCSARPARSRRTELCSAILGLQGEAEHRSSRRRRSTCPDEMEPRAALAADRARAAPRRPATPSPADPRRARRRGRGRRPARSTAIAGADAGFLASDVLYDARVQPVHQPRSTRPRSAGRRSRTSQFLPESPGSRRRTSPPQLGQQLSTGSGDGDAHQRQRADRPRPARHRPGRHVLRRRHAAARRANRLTYVAGQPFTVSFTNQGENDEFNVKVTLKITRASGGKPLTSTRPSRAVAKGEKATVELPLNTEPPLDTAVTIAVTVDRVAGEKKTDNNKSTYPSLFVAGLALRSAARARTLSESGRASSRSPRRLPRCSR